MQANLVRAAIILLKNKYSRPVFLLENVALSSDVFSLATPIKLSVQVSVPSHNLLEIFLELKLHSCVDFKNRTVVL